MTLESSHSQYRPFWRQISWQAMLVCCICYTCEICTGSQECFSFWRAAFTETLFMKGTVNYCLSVRSAAASHLLCWVFLWCSFNHDQICWWHKTRWVKNGHVARPEMLWPWEIRGREAMGSKGRLTVHKYRVLKGKGEEWWGKINIGSIKGNSLSRLLSQCCPNMSFYENNQLRLHSPKIAQMEWGRANAQNEKLLRILL